MKAILMMAASAQAIQFKYVPSSDVYIQFLDKEAQIPEEHENLQLEWHAPPAWDEVYDTTKGDFNHVVKDGDILIPAEEMDKFWVPNRFFPVEGVFNTHNGKYPGREMASYDKLETEPENSYDLVKKDW